MLPLPSAHIRLIGPLHNSKGNSKGCKEPGNPAAGHEYRWTARRQVVHRRPPAEKPWKERRNVGLATDCPQLWRLVWSVGFPLQIRVFFGPFAAEKPSLRPRLDAAIVARRPLRTRSTRKRGAPRRSDS
jgi:hypothetical protein